MIKLKTQTKNKEKYQNNKYNTFILLEESDKEKIDEDSISIADLRKTDIDILKILSENEDENTLAIFSFNGFKIRLNLHQEILSRSLKRLKELGLISKTKLGYKTTKNGKIIFSKLKKISNQKKDEQKYYQIIQISVPFILPNQQIVQSLSGKWFNSLRWIGMTQNVSAYQLKWKDIEEFIEIVVYLSNNNISIETNDNPLKISKAFGYSTRIIEAIGNVIMKNNLILYPIHSNDFDQITN
jgi:DNA-binding Lrp family transcriptional regulator